MGAKLPDAAAALMATTENLYEVVAMLRPDLCLVPRRAIDVAITTLIETKHHEKSA